MIFANRLFQKVLKNKKGTLLGVATTISLTAGCSTIVAPLEQKDEVVKLEGFSIQSEKNGLSVVSNSPDSVTSGQKFDLKFTLSTVKTVKIKTLTDPSGLLFKNIIIDKTYKKSSNGSKVVFDIIVPNLTLKNDFSGSFIGTVEVIENDSTKFIDTFKLNKNIALKPPVTNSSTTITSSPSTKKAEIASKATMFLNQFAPISVFGTLAEVNASSDISGTDRATWLSMIDYLFSRADRKNLSKKDEIIGKMVEKATSYNESDRKNIAIIIYNAYSNKDSKPKQEQPDNDATKLKYYNQIATDLGLRMQCKPFVDYILKQIGLTTVTTSTYSSKITSSLDVGNILYMPSLPHWAIITSVSTDKKSFSYISSNIANKNFFSPVGEIPNIRTVIVKTTNYDPLKHIIIDPLK